jgi:hypothetical protein
MYPQAMLSILLAALWVGPAMSGSWYSPERNGEGFTLQVLDNGTAHALWFTYPPAGAAGQQAWIYASGGRIEGDRIRFEGAFTTRGPRFGATFDPAAVQVIPWGTLEFRFTGCNAAELTYAGPAAWGSGTRAVSRLTALAELECTGKRQLTARGARAMAGLRSRSGAWFDPAHNGEGWNVEELPDGRAQVYWFTYDGNGEQAWTIGVAPAVSANRVVVADNFRPVGTRFGAAFNAAQVQATPWGRLELELSTCLAGVARYESALAGFGAGTLAPTRLTVPAGAVCLDSTPAVPTNAAWSQGAPMPLATSESATAILGGMAYVAGGFGALAGLQRYDLAANAWTTLAPMPAGRDHPLAMTIGGDVYVTGGNRQDSSPATDGWRYVVAENRWESIAQLPDYIAAGAAALAGFAYFSSGAGDLLQYDPRTRATRTIPGDDRAPRDHSQMVAFQGELWMLGGRNVTRTVGIVSIYDPASETWRSGPLMPTARAGFAAAASATLLFVGGGELITTVPNRTLNGVEAIAAGDDQFTAMPNLPSPVHGVGGALQGNGFYVLGGSSLAGGIANLGAVQVLRW